MKKYEDIKKENLFKEKEKYRKESINFDFDKKLRILAQLQERAKFFGHTDVVFRFDENYKFENIIDLLNDLKKNKLISDYVLGGSVALTYYTQPNIPTNDIDIFITPKNNSTIFNISPIYDYLKNNYGAIEQKEWIEINGIPIQFLSPDIGLHGEAFKNAQKKKSGGKEFKIFSLEYLIAIMLLLSNKKYKARLEQLIDENNFDIKKLEPILKKYNLLHKWNKLKESIEEWI